MDRHRTLLALLSGVAYADGELSNDEFSFLYHTLSRLTSSDTARLLVADLASGDAKVREERLREAVVAVERLPDPERLFLLLLAYDFAAVEGINTAEADFLARLGRQLRVRAADERLLAWSVDALSPGPEPGGARSADLSVAHLTPADLPGDATLTLTIVRLEDDTYVRVFDATGPVLVDDRPAPWQAWIPIGDDTRLAIPPFVLLRADIEELQARVGDLSDCPIERDGQEAGPGRHVRWWRLRGQIGLEALAGGVVRVDDEPLDQGERRTLLGHERVVDDGVRLDLGPILTHPSRAAARLGACALSRRSTTDAGGAREPADSGQGGPALDGLRVSGVSVAAGQTTLLDDVSFRVGHGELIAVIGPSGGGKTTLLEAMSGRRELAAGGVAALLDGALVPIAAVSDRIGFVPQEDLLLPQLTVRENVSLACQVRMPDMSREAIGRLVDATIAQVGLGARIDLRVGTPENRVLSGGQRKRVGVAMELASRPDVLLLDEPLSGLSSYDAHGMLLVLSDIARRGRIVVVVLHQPSTTLFRQFDRVVVIDRGGKLAYCGAADDAIRYFAQHGLRRTPGIRSPTSVDDESHPDVILDTLEQRRPSAGEAMGGAAARVYPPDYWKALFAVRMREGAEAPEQEGPAQEDGAGGAWAGGRRMGRRVARQLRTIVHRHALVRVRNRAALALSFFLAPFLGVFLGFVLRGAPRSETYAFGGNNLVEFFLFLVPVVSFFLAMSGSCTEFLAERRLIRQETALGVPPLLFLVSKLLVLLLWTAMETALFVVPAIWILQVPFGLLPWTFVLAFATACVGLALGLLVSAAANGPRLAYSFVPLALVPQLMFCGIVPYGEMNPDIYVPPSQTADAPIVGQVMASRWCFEGLVVAFADHAGARSVRDRLEVIDTAEREAGKRRREGKTRLDERRAEMSRTDFATAERHVDDAFRGARTRLAAERRETLKRQELVDNRRLRERFLDAERRFGEALASDPVNVLFASERWLVGARLPTPVAALLVLLGQAALFLLPCALCLRRLCVTKRARRLFERRARGSKLAG